MHKTSASFASWPWTFAVLLFFFCLPVSRAQDFAVKLDPAGTTVDFTLGGTLHTVHGTFKLKSGEIRVDPASGKANGSIVVDATSGDSGDSSRDHKMHKEILESDKYPDISFSPAQLTPQPGHTLRETLTQKGITQVQADGVFRLHGADHNVRLDLAVQNEGNGRLEISSSFPIPYIKWGLKSPNTLILRVSDTVDLEIRAAAQIAAQPQS
ncbi:MAG TPA: YceI family protein [Candidatus Aquilonibacter sp.]|nr:YceI family protein [Candidatus Aquilonibacter sp.]